MEVIAGRAAGRGIVTVVVMVAGMSGGYRIGVLGDMNIARCPVSLDVKLGVHDPAFVVGAVEVRHVGGPAIVGVTGAAPLVKHVGAQAHMAGTVHAAGLVQGARCNAIVVNDPAAPVEVVV